MRALARDHHRDRTASMGVTRDATNDGLSHARMTGGTHVLIMKPPHGKGNAVDQRLVADTFRVSVCSRLSRVSASAYLCTVEAPLALTVTKRRPRDSGPACRRRWSPRDESQWRWRASCFESTRPSHCGSVSE